MHSVLQFYGTCSLVRSAIATECGIYDHSIHYIQDNLIRHGSTLLSYFIIINQEAKTIPSSKTLLSGNAKAYILSTRPFSASIDERTRVPDKSAGREFRSMESFGQGQRAMLLMEMVLVPRRTCFTEGDCLTRATRKLLQGLVGFDTMCCDKTPSTRT